ncbi:membrane protein [Candidatus Photodesmus blepharus]|uniref:Membrane protein n=1 Tax=Candidatus Photodesmus blepharonis TaxID=1179155 RepID=A0A084CND1_9GAMM|nr:NfeD family protein [Candidatus Photodesmus blepharus]KEY91310.1 membrane protein [Candidatus Photodesmus blepharus]
MVENPDQIFIIVGIILIIIEVALLGESAFIFLFTGISMIFSGVLMGFNFIETNWLWAFSLTTAFTVLLLLIFWKPLKKIQNKVEKSEDKTDFYNKEFILEEYVDMQSESKYHYSGIQWNLKSFHPIEKGTLVKIDKIEVGIIWIKEK